jgi:hypothetical protein
MKRIHLLSLTAAIFLFGTVLYSCKDAGEGVSININTKVLSSPTALQFVNAKKDAPNQPKSFPITIGGKDAASVVTINNKTDFNAAEGRIFLALKKGVVPSETNPIIFTVAAEVPGFAPATKTFRITTDAALSVTVPLVEYANPVVGTSAKLQENALVAGASATAFSIQTPVSSSMTSPATISIAAGTQFLDADGKVINATKLESRIINYGTDSQESLAAFPGGFEATNVIGQNGQPIVGGVAFITGGFIAIDMYAGGVEVKRFSKPLDVKMGVSKQLINPETGVVVKAGDVLPVWSLDDKSGQWAFESNATIITGPTGDLTASFSASHLSYWNLDWTINFCPNNLKLKFNAPNYTGELYRVTIESDKGYASDSWMTITDLLSTTFRVPSANIRVVVSDRNFNVITKTDFFNSCSQGAMDIKMPTSASLDVINVDMVLQGVCPNKPINANVSAWVRLYEEGVSVSKAQIVYANNGKLNIKVKNNTKYFVEAFYGDKWKSTSILFTKTNFTFPGSITGTAVYIDATKTLNVSAQFPLPDCN